MTRRLLTFAACIAAIFLCLSAAPESQTYNRAFGPTSNPTFASVTATNGVTVTGGGATIQAGAFFVNLGRSGTGSAADGKWYMVRNDGGTGVTFQFTAVPTIGACGTSPTVTAGSLDSVGEVTVGNAGTLTSCVVNFASTWTNAPKCVAGMSTAVAADTRALGITTSTTIMTVTPAAAFTASTKFWWLCQSQK